MSTKEREDGTTPRVLSEAIAEFNSTLHLDAGARPQDFPRKGANPTRRKNALGRGLSALMSATVVRVDAEPSSATTASSSASSATARGPATPGAPHVQAIGSLRSAAPSESQDGAELSIGQEPLEGGLVYLSVDRIVPNASQPRQLFSQPEIDELSASIKASGLLQPIIVRRTAGEVGPLSTYEIVAGERRWRAATQAGLPRIPALVRQLSDRETLELGIIENVQREDLNAIEEAQAYQRLISDFGATQEDVARTVGKDRVSIANALRLLKLPAEVQELIQAGTISAGHGRALLMLSSTAEQQALAARTAKERLSVRALERLVSEMNAERRPSKPSADADAAATPAPQLRELEERFRRALGTKVGLKLNRRGGGELKIEFFSPAELESLLEKLGA